MEPFIVLGDIDRRAWKQGYVLVGVDEVGRGPIAGPVSAGAVLMAGDLGIEGINDSKKVSEKKRMRVAEEIKKNCAWQVTHVSHEEIDEIGLRDATFKAMRKSAVDLIKRWVLMSKGNPKNVFVLVDGPEEIPKMPFKQKAIVGGDSKSLVVAAASIVAKVDRDEIMIGYDEQWPDYGFAKHKGYGTPQHIRAVETIGLCPIHRRSVRTAKKKDTHDKWLKAKETAAPWQVLQKLGAYE